MHNEKMTLAVALDILRRTEEAAGFVDSYQQKTVNAQGELIAAMVQEKAVINGEGMFRSWKVKKNTSKYAKATEAMIKLTEAHLEWEAKLKAIPTTATKNHGLPLPV